MTDTSQNARSGLSSDANPTLQSVNPALRLLGQVPDEECHVCRFSPLPQQPSRDTVHPAAPEPASIGPSQATYEYESIKPWQIRLLLVHPGPPSADLVANLHVAYFVDSLTEGGEGAVLKQTEEKVQYHALSYCWGSPDLTHALQVDGRRCSITSNLFVALRHLRCADAPAYFWIDALCIDQKNLEERSKQVQNMLLVYQNATAVRVWLGEATRASGLVFDYQHRSRYHDDPICLRLAASQTLQHRQKYGTSFSWEDHVDDCLGRRSAASASASASNHEKGDDTSYDQERSNSSHCNPSILPETLRFIHSSRSEESPRGWEMERESIDHTDRVWPAYSVPTEQNQLVGGTRDLDSRAASICVEHARVLHDGLLDLLGRPWFGRIWVRQEIWAARAVTVLCGHASLGWERFCSIKDLAVALDAILPRSARHQEHPLAQRFCDTLRGLRMASMSERLDTNKEDSASLALGPLDIQGDIIRVIASASHCDCANPQDRIYGLLGMTRVKTTIQRLYDQPYGLHLNVDYTKHPCEVFEDLMVYLIRRELTLAPLALAASFGTDVAGRRLPSWVVDWRKPLTIPWATAVLHTVNDATPSINEAAKFTSPGVLRVNGYVLGEVSKIYRDFDSLTHVLPLRAKQIFAEASKKLGSGCFMVEIDNGAMCNVDTRLINDEYATSLRDIEREAGRILFPEGHCLFAVRNAVRKRDYLTLVVGSGPALILRRSREECPDYRYVGPGLPIAHDRYGLANWGGHDPSRFFQSIREQLAGIAGYKYFRKFNIV